MTKNNQNMIEIEESGMKFGPFEFSHVFQIEKSKLYKNLHNIKTVEFILENNNKFKFIYLILRNPCVFKENRHFNVRSLCIFPCFCPYEPKQGKLFV